MVSTLPGGTIWTQNILCLMFKESQGNAENNVDIMAKAPWLEFTLYKDDFDSRPSPRLFSSHLLYYLMPKDMRNRKGKVIYVLRNPKDIVVSFYHFHNFFVNIQHVSVPWEAFFDLYLSGQVIGGSWFDHVRGWYTHKEEFNCLFLTYEEMIQDLRSAVLKMCNFIDMKLDDQAVNRIVEKATFKNMKKDPLANYTFLTKELFDHSTTRFLSKGTIWTQNILCLIYKEKKINVEDDVDNMTKAPWIESNLNNTDFDSRPSPRIFTSHLHYYLMPKDLRKKRGKIIYVSRNPKDIVVSYYHFLKLQVKLQHITLTWEAFFDHYISGKVGGGSWFDHVRGWYTHKDEFNCLFLSYEEMIKDLRSAVLKIWQFVDVTLDDHAVNRIVEKATFKNMKQDPLANYTFLPKDLLDYSKGSFLRKGTIGDWKNIMTVAQSEKVDAVLKEKLGDLPITFIWDINEIQ